MTLAHIVRALGGDLWAGGRRANVPAPGHSAEDRSISLLLAGDRVVAHGFGGVGWQEVLADLATRGLVDADGQICGGAVTAKPAPVRTRAERTAAAARLWAAGGDLAGTVSERHIRRRGVAHPSSTALRHHGAVPAAVYDDRGPCRPALMAAIQGPDGELCAVEVTYLAADGARARLRLPRKTIGVLPPGCAVRLDTVEAELLVAEGVFSALSASERFGLPGWALLSTSNLRSWTPPDGVRRVLIAGDRGADGERSARILAARLRRLGVVVRLAWPPAPFGDWNDAAGMSPEEGVRGGAGEPGGWMVRTDGSE
ncbi:DUF7146 domain-containing protein [Phenylobacterium sp.]|uniref:DUF7146 domain-containing protein n=1 Tax=Phenylobacterium sp. TaxID=1871053 RepID=UPI003BA8C2F4